MFDIYRIIAVVFGIVFLASGAIPAAEKEIAVPIRVVERTGQVRTAEPVTVGVPVPRGMLKNVDTLKLVGPDGKDVPAQFSAATYWWHTAEGAKGEKSVKWIHVDFQADVPAKGESIYTLKTGGAGTAKGSPLKATLKDNSATVETGVMKFTVKGNKFNLIDEAWIGKHQIVKPHEGGIVLLSNLDGKDKNTVYSSIKSPAKVEIETVGPERVVIRVQGKLAKSDGNGPDTLLDYVCRVTAYKNKSYVVTELAYHNKHRQEDKGIRARIPMDGLMVDIPTTLTAPVQCALPKKGDPTQGTLSNPTDLMYVWAMKSDSVLFAAKQSDSATAKSVWAKEPGRLIASDAACTVGAGVRWFWQTWPKALEMNGAGRLAVHLWPNISREALKVPDEWANERSLHSRLIPQRANVYLGMSHTYRFFLSFAKKDDRTVSDQAWWKLTQPLRGVCPPAWYCEDTRAFGLIGSSTKERYEDDKWKMVSEYDTRLRTWHDFISYERPKKYYGSEDGFGEFNFGDHQNFDYNTGTDVALDLLWDNNYYGFPHACIIQFARTGDLAFLDTAVRFGTHLQDVDMMCDHPKANMVGCNRYSPSAQHIFADHSIAQQSFGGKNNQRVYASNTYNHFKNQSHFERWYLLGDRHALDMGLMSADFVVQRTTRSLSQGRSVGHGIVGSLSGWYATGDTKYLDAARSIVRAKKQFSRTKSGAWQDGIAAEGFMEYYLATGSVVAYEAAKRAGRAAYEKNNAAGSMLHAFALIAAHDGEEKALEFAINAKKGNFLTVGTPNKSWGSVMNFGNSLRNTGWFIWYLQKGERKVTEKKLPGWED
ncbi:DUF6288 domain-containing protein [Planctomycetota bacterium]